MDLSRDRPDETGCSPCADSGPRGQSERSAPALQRAHEPSHRCARPRPSTHGAVRRTGRADWVPATASTTAAARCRSVPAIRPYSREMLPVETPHGLAHMHLDLAARPTGALVLGHGASGGVGARDLVAVATVARSEGFCVALVEQPYRVAGRRSPAPAPPARRVVDRRRRAPARRGATRSAARSWRSFLRRTRRVPDGRCHGRSRHRLPRLPTAATAPVGRVTGAESPARARCRHGADARRAGRTRPVRDAACGPGPHRR